MSLRCRVNSWCLPPQCLLALLTRRWQGTMTCTCTAAAPPWGAPPVDFQPLHKSSGSGCPKRTVQRPSRKFLQCVCVCVKKEQTSFLCMHAVFTCFSVTHCQQVVDSGEDWLLSWCWQKQERRQWDRTLTRCRSADMIHVLHNVHF